MYLISSKTELANSYWTGKTGFGTIRKAKIYSTKEEAKADLEYINTYIEAKIALRMHYRGALTYQPPEIREYESDI